MKINAVKLIPLSGILSVVLYFLHVILGEIFYEGYNPLTQAISDLTALNSPSRNIAKIFSMLYGVCTVIFSIGFFAYFKNKINKAVKIASFVFCIMNTISFFGYTLGTLLLLMTGAMLINLLPKEYFGVAERINVYSIIIFTGILSLWMNKYLGKLDLLRVK
jgi:hypothetical membrane protein